MCCHSHMHHKACMPKCIKRCVGVYKVYEKCCHEIVKVCPYCGYEFDHYKHQMCPMCGAPVDDPPRFGRFRGRSFGGFDRFERHRRFPGFFPFAFGGFPFFDEEEEDEEF